MSNIVFVAPFFLPTTLRFIAAVAAEPGVRLGLVSQEPEAKLPDDLRRRLDGHYRIDDGLDPRQIAVAVRALGRHFGGTVDRLLGALEELQVPLGQVRDELGITGMGAEVARSFRDKERMKTILRGAGLPCARHGLAADSKTFRQVAQDIGFPLVVKPPAGAGARSTFRLDDPAQLEEYLQTMPPRPDAPALIEEFIVGEEFSFDSVFVDGKLRWHSINHYYPSPLDVLRNPWIQWCVLLPREIDDPRYDEIRKVGSDALRTLGMRTGLSHMEWFRRTDGSVAVSEVGARPPGAQFTTLMSYAHDTDMYRAWAHVSVTGEFTPLARPFAAGAAYLRGQGKGQVKAIHGLSEIQRELGSLVVEAQLPRLGQGPAGGYEGQGYVILRHPETAVVEQGLARLIQTIRIEMS